MREKGRDRERERERAETMAAASALATRLGRERERMRWMDCQRETDSITRFNVKAAVAVAEEGSKCRANPEI